VKKISLIAISFWSLSNLSQASENSIEGFWFASGSIVEIKVCKKFICAEVVHIITEEGKDPSTVLDENNDDKELRSRTLIGVNLFDGFEKELLSDQPIKGGRIYDPRRGKFYNAELAMLENGNLFVEACLLFICDGEEWLPLVVTINPDGSRQATPKGKQDI
jgi:uncharacterized protein (DUF2147 family)